MAETLTDRHEAAHDGDVVHGYVLAHLKDGVDAQKAETDVRAIVPAGGLKVSSIDDVAGALVIFVVGDRKHGPRPDVAWHNVLAAFETQVQNQPTRPNSYFAWTRHY